MRWAKNVAQIEAINAFKFLDGKYEGSRSLESLNVGSYNIKMNINDVDWESGDFICLIQNRTQWSAAEYNVGNLLSR
jgi:hypothetical protein